MVRFDLVRRRSANPDRSKSSTNVSLNPALPVCQEPSAPPAKAMPSSQKSSPLRLALPRAKKKNIDIEVSTSSSASVNDPDTKSTASTPTSSRGIFVGRFLGRPASKFAAINTNSMSSTPQSSLATAPVGIAKTTGRAESGSVHGAPSVLASASGAKTSGRTAENATIAGVSVMLAGSSITTPTAAPGSAPLTRLGNAQRPGGGEDLVPPKSSPPTLPLASSTTASGRQTLGIDIHSTTSPTASFKHDLASSHDEDRDRNPCVTPTHELPRINSNGSNSANTSNPSAISSCTSATISSLATSNISTTSVRRSVVASNMHLPPTSKLDSFSKRPRGLVGLQNLGNTCFMNSCLQCVASVPSIIEFFSSEAFANEINDKSPTKGALTIAFGELMKSLLTGAEFTSTRPVELKRVIGKVANRFMGYDQQDAQEFLRFFIDGLHEELNRIKTKPAYYEIQDKTPQGDPIADRPLSEEFWKFYRDRNDSQLSSVFCGQLRSEIRCHSCNSRSICFDVFWDLSLPIPKKAQSTPKRYIPSMRIANVFGNRSAASHAATVSAAASSQADSETDASSGASSTTSNGATSPSFSGVTLQDCLRAYTEKEILQEDDGYFCPKCKTHRAADKRICIYRLPQVLVLHLKRFSFSTFSRDKVNTTIKFPSDQLEMNEFCSKEGIFDNLPTVYDLTGVVNHMGSLNGGHYTAECRNADTDEWYDFNDASVSLVKKPTLCSASAYILFFNRRKPAAAKTTGTK